MLIGKLGKKGVLVVLFLLMFSFFAAIASAQVYIARSSYNSADCFTKTGEGAWQVADDPCHTCVDNPEYPEGNGIFDGDGSANDLLAVACGYEFDEDYLGGEGGSGTIGECTETSCRDDYYYERICIDNSCVSTPKPILTEQQDEETQECINTQGSDWCYCLLDLIGGVENANCLDDLHYECFRSHCDDNAEEIFGCREDWECSEWGVCTESLQSRTCTDTNECGTFFERPSLLRYCDQDTEPEIPDIPDCSGFVEENGICYELEVAETIDGYVCTQVEKGSAGIEFDAEENACKETTTLSGCEPQVVDKCLCYEQEEDNCEDEFWLICTEDCEVEECESGFFRDSYNSDSCYTYTLEENRCIRDYDIDSSSCLGVLGNGICEEDLLATALGECEEPVACETEYQRSEENAYDCQFSSPETECRWIDTATRDCLGTMGTNDCDDPIFLQFGEHECDVVDSDEDGVIDDIDECADSQGIVDDRGCSCSQKTCDDSNVCTENSCVDGQCVYYNYETRSCGSYVQCPADGCTAEEPVEFLDYPSSGYGSCSEGVCIERNCEVISADPDICMECDPDEEDCEPVVCNPEQEVCDGVDNDCDGLVDENLERECGSSSLGICEKGTEQCVDGEWVGCDSVEPEEEVCDGADNDCNGAIDDNIGCECLNGERRSCGIDTGICEAGTQLCSNNRWGSCDDEILPEEEVCDGLDNDCDGLVDEHTNEQGSYSIIVDCSINVCSGQKICGQADCELFNDADNDRRCPAIDNCPNNYNPGQEDSDGDGIGDACDICVNDPDNDIDGDNTCGNLDNCPATSNDQRDSDDDNIGDACDNFPDDPDNDIDNDGIGGNIDNCRLRNNPSQADCDSDGRGDACDPDSACSTDSDNDGVMDIRDNCPEEYNPAQQDSDSDSIGNACDSCRYDNENDIDNDGVCGDIDNCEYDSNPGQTDSDNDGRGDVCDSCVYDPDDDADNDHRCSNIDNCPAAYNPSQADCDDDGIGDACDYSSLCSKDNDEDTVFELYDNCPEEYNPEQQDSDNDGIGDACDFCPFDSFNDEDNDGVCGNIDNCPTIENSDQSNRDDDEFGDLCDICPEDELNDYDSDGICESYDNCGLRPNPSQADCDNDNIGDACDRNSNCISDSDNDGLSDNNDNCPERSNPGQLDKDGDSVGDACDFCPDDPLNDADRDGVCGNLDNCPTLSNKNQLDNDGDSTGDMCDICPYDLENDRDNDNICGNLDNCRYKFNPDQRDCDNDNKGDVCDTNSECVADSDLDGFADNNDNCPSDPNPGQQDFDNDNIGDVCDSCPEDRLNDLDNDNVCAAADNCPKTYNPGQKNTDKDLLGDACDLCPEDGNNDIDEDGVCGNLDTCPYIKNPGQEDDCDSITVEEDIYDDEVVFRSTLDDIQDIIEESYGYLEYDEAQLKSYDDLKESITVEKKEYWLDDILFTRYKITIDTDQPITDFSYYMKIPKCLAEKTDKIYFNGKNYQIIESDPIIAWHFTEIDEKVEMTYDVKGSISESCLNNIKDFAFAASNTEFEKKPINFIIPIAVIIIIILIFLVFEQHLAVDNKFDEILQSKVAEIKEKYDTSDRQRLRQQLLNEGMNEKYLKEIMKRL